MQIDTQLRGFFTGRNYMPVLSWRLVFCLGIFTAQSRAERSMIYTRYIMPRAYIVLYLYSTNSLSLWLGGKYG